MGETITEPTVSHDRSADGISYRLRQPPALVCPPELAIAEERRRPQSKQPEDEEVAPPEDLMREHGVLNRVLLVFDEAVQRIDAKQELPPDPVPDSAALIRIFIEDYHEKLEEDYLFPRFEKAGRLADLTKVLRAQHQAARRLTDQITQLATLKSVKDPARTAKRVSRRW